MQKYNRFVQLTELEKNWHRKLPNLQSGFEKGFIFKILTNAI